MQRLYKSLLTAGFALVTLATGRGVQAAPTIRIMPPNGARFLADQRFDIRVEFTPATGATMTTAGVRIGTQWVNFSSLDANRGVTIRNRSFTVPGVYEIYAYGTDSANGTVTRLTSYFRIIDPNGGKRPIRNVIILLGDGMGASHRTAARIMKYGVTNGYANGFLAMDRMPGTGLVMTHSLNSIITDSAPGMASYVTGNKSNNNQEGVFPDNTSDAWDNPRVEYMGAYLKRKMGKSLGIVTTADVEDATPASMAIHTANRGAGTGICDQYLDEANRSGLAVLMGGGRRWFLPQKDSMGNTVFGSSRSAGNDCVLTDELATAWGVPKGVIDPNRNLLQDFQNAGFAYAGTRTEMNALAANTTKLLGLFAYGNMNTSLDKITKRRYPGLPGVVDDYHAPDQPLLEEMTGVALNVLNKNPNGFVLLVEGAHIDKQSHAMDAERAIWDTIEFDNAVKKCLDFADLVPDTLVIVTADHECSGFSIIGASKLTTSALRALPPEAAVLDPNTQPQRQNAVGTYDQAGFPFYGQAADGYPVQTDPNYKMLIGYGGNGDRYEDWLLKPLPIVDSLLSDDIKAQMRAGTTASGSIYVNEPVDRTPAKSNGFFIRGQAVGKSQAVHTASDIPLSAYSTTSTVWVTFSGVQDNTDVFFKMMRAVFGGW